MKTGTVELVQRPEEELRFPSSQVTVDSTSTSTLALSSALE